MKDKILKASYILAWMVAFVAMFSMFEGNIYRILLTVSAIYICLFIKANEGNWIID